MSPPAWLYLPHLGCGGGQSGGGGAAAGTSPGGECMSDSLNASGGAVHTAQASSSATNTSEDLEGREPYAGQIRGRSLPPGSDEATDRPSIAGAVEHDSIRGRDDAAPGHGRGTSEGSLEVRAAREVSGPRTSKGAGRTCSTGMSWYFADIAATAAKRKSAGEHQMGPSAADRMAALRRRVADRAREHVAVAASGPAAALCTTSGHHLARQQNGTSTSGAVSSGDRISVHDPGDNSRVPHCSTARTEAATAVAHHAIAEEPERQGAVGASGRCQQSEARSSWGARRALLASLAVARPSE